MSRALLVLIVVAASVICLWIFWAPKPSRQKTIDIIAGNAVQHQQSKAYLDIEISSNDHLTSVPDGKVVFKVEADATFPEDPNVEAKLRIDTFPSIDAERDSEKDLTDGRRLYTYKASANASEFNLVKIRATLCEPSGCTGKLNKIQERIVDVGAQSFDGSYKIRIHPDESLVAGRITPEAYIDLQLANGNPLKPTSNIKLNLSDPNGCLEFRKENEPTSKYFINLLIDADHGKLQTERFLIRPTVLAEQKCPVQVAVYDDEKQRAAPRESPAITVFTSPKISVGMCFLGGAIALAMLTWRRAKQQVHPYLSLMVLIEYVIKACLAVVMSSVLTTTDFIGMTIDKSSARGFFTTGFFLGFVPLDDIFDAILRKVGVSKPPNPAPHSPTELPGAAAVPAEH